MYTCFSCQHTQANGPACERCEKPLWEYEVRQERIDSAWRKCENRKRCILMTLPSWVKEGLNPDRVSVDFDRGNVVGLVLETGYALLSRDTWRVYTSESEYLQACKERV